MSKFIQSGFPVTRLRRLRRSAALRDMFRETSLSPADFIYPLFIVEGENLKKEISSMPALKLDLEEISNADINDVF